MWSHGQSSSFERTQKKDREGKRRKRKDKMDFDNDLIRQIIDLWKQ